MPRIVYVGLLLPESGEVMWTWNCRRRGRAYALWATAVGGTSTAYVLIRLQIEQSGDAGFQPQPVNVINRAGMRADEQPGKKLRVVHFALEVKWPLRSNSSLRL